jgi:hypothetical protein
MKKNSMIFILAAVFITQIAAIPVFGDIVIPPISREYSDNVAKKTKMKKGFIQDYNIEYKKFKGVVINGALSFEVEPYDFHQHVSAKILVKKDDFVKKGEAVALPARPQYYPPDGKIHSPISGYVVSDTSGGNRDAILIKSELLVRISDNIDLKYFGTRDNIVYVTFPKYPEVTLEGYVFYGIPNSFNKKDIIEYGEPVFFTKNGISENVDIVTYVKVLNRIPDKYKTIIKAGTEVLITANFNSNKVAIIANEFLYEHKGKKKLIQEVSHVAKHNNHLGNTYESREAITGVSNDEYTEIFYPVNLYSDFVIFKDDAKRDFILKNGKDDAKGGW